jgi:hypothetical protein
MADRGGTMTQGVKNDHEKSDARVGTLFVVGAGLLGLILVSFAAMFFLWKVFEKNPPPVTTQVSETAIQGALPPEPRLQADPPADLAAFRAYEDSLLDGYGWVDRTKGTVRVPIDSAMAMVARKGLPFDTTLERRGK